MGLGIWSKISSSPRNPTILNPRNPSRRMKKLMESVNTSKVRKNRILNPTLSSLFCLRNSRKNPKRENTIREGPTGSTLRQKKQRLLTCTDMISPWLKLVVTWTFPLKTSKDGQNRKARSKTMRETRWLSLSRPSTKTSLMEWQSIPNWSCRRWGRGHCAWVRRRSSRQVRVGPGNSWVSSSWIGYIALLVDMLSDIN